MSVKALDDFVRVPTVMDMPLQESLLNWLGAKEQKESWQHSRSAEVPPGSRVWSGLSPKKRYLQKKQRRCHDGLRQPIGDGAGSS